MNYELQLKEFGDRLQINTTTPGGVTFILDGKPRCLRKKTLSSGFCMNGAGRDTDHYGMGACSKHGGNAGRPPTTGRYARVANKEFHQAIDRMVQSDIMDLGPTLAGQQAMYEELTRRFWDSNNEKEKLVLSAAMTKAAEQIASTTARIKKIELQKGVLTVSSARLMMIRAVEVQQRLLVEWFGPQEGQKKFEEWLLLWRKDVEGELLLTTVN